MANIALANVYGAQHQYWQAQNAFNANNSTKEITIPPAVAQPRSASSIPNFTGYSKMGDAPPKNPTNTGSRINITV
ncbi:hypothetical protein L4D13_21385 [Photobacterium profundum]|uniref:hypothetical protein n=1 Tax=Photobacterium profundum TaxID=74109 RepID=UPI003D10D571